MDDSRKHPPKDLVATKPAAAARGGLRLVKAETPQERQPEPRRKSHLVQFMNAYADAIDRDIQAILDL
jgi:hypothetical protein